ncbi:unnamed protein product [Candidula unifasciata]|uniref:G-protein coupled receptors family 1 profile domain-containing protein n=1 Tax=Candidula unifasciata TaxID=100452 RepID=A0A8S3ZSD2_9EUPU|nr:unnamed protein product [Candidula unifasciata]
MPALSNSMLRPHSRYIHLIVSIVVAASASSSAESSSALSTNGNTQLPTTPSSASLTIKANDLSLNVENGYQLVVVVVAHSTNMTVDVNQSQSRKPSLDFCINLTLTQIHDNFTECLPPLPKHLYFTDDNIVSVAAYSCMFIVAACGNLTVFITLFRNRRVKSRINMFIMHLAISDLIVTFVMLPLEIAWNSTVAWLAGDVACRLLTFFRAVGFYLSSFILVSISLDRYFAIMRPLSITDADLRAKVMLLISWLLSIVASVPQDGQFIEHFQCSNKNIRSNRNVSV